jgi:hypothetical protein
VAWRDRSPKPAFGFSGENLDLHIVSGTAVTFTVPGFIGGWSVSVLASVILALPATLALSQIRSRRAGES